MIINLIIVNTSRSQVLISLLLGDVLNSGGVEFGLTGGANMSWIDGQQDAKHLTTFNIGFYFDIRMKNQKEKPEKLMSSCTRKLSKMEQE